MAQINESRTFKKNGRLSRWFGQFASCAYHHECLALENKEVWLVFSVRRFRSYKFDPMAETRPDP